jgi:diguanylate cyclase (GGDEF)-like protein
LGSASHKHYLMSGLLGWLFLAVVVVGFAAPLHPEVAQLLARADELRTGDYQQFNVILQSIEKQRSSLNAAQQEYLLYLQAWKAGYDGDATTCLARLTALLQNSTDPTLRMRAGATMVNMLVFGKRYEEAFARLSEVLALLPQVTDGRARQQALLNAAELYNGVGQYDLSLSYSQQIIDANWGGRGFCTGWHQKLQSFYYGGRATSVGPDFYAAVDDCVKNGELGYADSIRVVGAKEFVKLKQPDAAISLLKPRYEAVQSERNPRLLSHLEATLAEAYHLKGSAPLAQEFATHVTETMNRDEYSEPLVTAFQVLYELAKQRGDYKTALDYHEQYAIADKAYLTDLSARHLAYQTVNHQDLANKLQVEALNKENHVLQLQRELSSKAMETSRLYIALLTMAVVFIGLWAYRTKRSQLHFQNLSQLDGLTGICNRPHFIAQAEKILEASRRSGERQSIVLFDLDHFKSINDRYGHATGDFVLKRTVSACKLHLEKGDIFGRFGGEEFAILLPSCSSDEGRERAERLRVTIASITAYHGTTKATVSASFGVSTTDASGHGLGQLLAHADTALYAAKRSGRNCVVVHGDQTAEVTPLNILTTTGEYPPLQPQVSGRSSTG